ncbi:Spatacsin C-terminal domain [Arabidopsis thaliana x Arabidopsis arenosa]|uniref:Spatacsin C-terminal domain n=1 Tax=Arabidopsis thaliana x Arabidopsis arenosa TaxID=1240361 RepID=A0A8T1XXP3_9BRAS|nr:Spatacsin C-terminal domain [Arabidopsis thaliana x Arabidopsis arenosa]
MERLVNEGPTLLQLHKWEPSQLQLKLSEFREAFISPSRQLLLLLSYHSQALLLPLVAGRSIGSEVSVSCHSEEPNSPTFSGGSDPPSGSGVGSGEPGFVDNFSSSCNSFPFIFDAKSVAWGSCGDTYNRHKDPLFRELLFVSGNHGVTVHAFCCTKDSSNRAKDKPNGELRHGEWVEWGPSRLNQKSEHERVSSFDGAKQWMQSFLIDLETTEIEGIRQSRFPEKSAFPASAEVVSFSILNTDLPFSNLLFQDNSILQKDNMPEDGNVNDNNFLVASDPTALDEKSRADMPINNASVSSLYRCIKVFSSDSHSLIGFVMELSDCASTPTSNENERSKGKRIVFVAKLFSWGIEWASLVKFGESSIGPTNEWADFRLSDKFVICLSVSGLIFLYDVNSGDFISHGDILQTCSRGLYSSSDMQEATAEVDQRSNFQNRVPSMSKTCIVGSADRRRKFRKLIVASHTPLIAAVDENGLVYVLCVDDFVSKEYHMSVEPIPDLRHLGLGSLVGWKIGGMDVGQKKVHHPSSSGSRGEDAFSRCDPSFSASEISISDPCLERKHNNFDRRAGYSGSWLSGFSAQPKTNLLRLENFRRDSHVTRKMFLSTEKLGLNDNICFSPLGFTHFSRKYTNKDDRSCKIFHYSLQTHMTTRDDSYLNYDVNNDSVQGAEESFIGESVGCSFQGFLYLVTCSGLSVFLPSISITSNYPTVEAIEYLQPLQTTVMGYQERDNLRAGESRFPWQVEVIDRVILFEGPEVADHVCLENGWDLKIARLRRLQMALDYLKYDDINESLKMLGNVKLAEEGMLRVLFSAVYLLSRTNRNDNQISAVSRLLGLATRFATEMIRIYGLLEYQKDGYMLDSKPRTQILSLPPVSLHIDVMENSRRLSEMGYLLEITRNFQSRITRKFKKLGKDDSQLEIVPDPASAESRQLDTSLFDTNGELALTPMGMMTAKAGQIIDERSYASGLVPQGVVEEKKVLPLENPKEMMARWKANNLDLKTVVKDALLSGRLPLAVLQLHLQHSKDVVEDGEHHDTFTEVRDIGRAIAYDLFLKGEPGVAIATLQRLGEDVEACLNQLVFGTVRRSIRYQIADEMRKLGFLRPYEDNVLERISLIERLYPSSHFWETYLARRKELLKASLPFDSSEISLHLVGSSLFQHLKLDCGEVDGVVLGSWTKINESASEHAPDETDAVAGYWAAAAVWSNAWDQRTFDHIVLDQPLVMGVHVPWDSQLEYYMCHNDWDEVLKLLDLIPEDVLYDGSLQIALDGPKQSSGVNYSVSSRSEYICSIEEVDAVLMDVPYIKIFRLPADIRCSLWLTTLMEQELARKLIFLKEYWENALDVVYLLARAGVILSNCEVIFKEETCRPSLDLCLSIKKGGANVDTLSAVHKLFIHYCTQYNLPNLLDLYLDHHELVLDNDSLSALQEAVGDSHWAKWLLLSRIKGREYDASFSNARSIMSRSGAPNGEPSVPETDEIVCTVDDIAEGAGEMAALATMMCAPVPIQKSLSTGSVNRHTNSSAQCTLENLRSFLQRFPTLWSKLVSACLGEDISGNLLRTKTKNVLSEYLNWRDGVFFSTARDTSLLQMLPCWFPKAVRRLVQLYIQGPLGWLSFSGYPTGEYLLHRGVEFFINVDDPTEISAISWEAIIQKHIEEELHHTKTEGTELGLEHFLHRGRPLSAFNAFLEQRVEKLKLEDQSGSSTHGQRNMQSDVPMLLAPLTQSDESLLSSVIPLAITHFGDSVLVASCAFLLELCGLSASMLRIDVASLRRISSFYKSNDNADMAQQKSLKGSMFHWVSSEDDLMGSLARALANEYAYSDISSVSKQKQNPNSISGTQPGLPLMLVLHHLEQASLPEIGVDRKTSGYWLLTGDGDGSELRSQQTSASLHWSLVTLFCQMHKIPLSTKYLAMLARDNDWVGFLSEAQLGGYPFDTVLNVASKEFGDQRLKAHILTVLRYANSKKKATILYSDDPSRGFSCSSSEDGAYVSAELFRVLAYSEKLKNPGGYLLSKAKELSWSILALIASCFPDVAPLSCLTIWLEITAARETSFIKVNDITTKIAENIGAAVVSTNSLPTDARGVQFHYNRRNPKRRRLTAHTSVDLLASADSVNTSAGKTFCSLRTEAAEDEKVEDSSVTNDSSDEHASLSKMVAVLCEQRLFLPLLKAFDLFLPSCSLLPFFRALQAFSQMRLSEASAHLGSFWARVKEESMHFQSNIAKDVNFGASWISRTAVKAADAVLSTCPSPYEKRCLLQLLAATDFGDGGSAATYYRRLYWKVNLAEPSLRDNDLDLGNESLDDGSLLTALEKNRQWEQARNWAKQLETIGATWTSSVHHVTETQAESMVAEWKEFLWDVPEERIALWGHCQTLFIRYSFPALQAGLFFLRHAEVVEKDLPSREIYELLLLSLQWLSGLTTLSHPVYPLHLLREIETRVWLLAVEAESHVKNVGAFSSSSIGKDMVNGNSSNLIDRTASIITKMDSHISSATKNRIGEKHDSRAAGHGHQRNQDTSTSIFGASTKPKRRAKGNVPQIRHFVDSSDRNTDFEDSSSLLNIKSEFQLQEENTGLEISLSKWEESIEPAELERAVLSLLEFGQVTAAKQLQLKLAPGNLPSELIILEAVMKLAMLSTPCSQVPLSMLDDEVRSVIQSQSLRIDQPMIEPLQVLENLSNILNEGSGRGLARKIIAVIKAANILGLTFTEAYQKQPIELLRLLSLKAQDSFEEACLLVQTHSMPAASIAQILAESFLKGLLAAHRGGYIDSQKEEGPAPLLWRFSDFLKWAELCPSEQEMGHALMRLVITGQEIPHTCEVELLILSHHFYKSSTCLDGVDVLVALAATRVEAYVAEGDFSCLARLITGVGNFHALNFILNILIENGQLDLLLQKFSAAAADANTGTAQAVRSFRMAVLTSLNLFNPNDHDAFAMVYKHFDMKHETATLLEARADQAAQQWFLRYDKDQNEDLLNSMRYYIEAAEVHTSIDAGNKARKACGQASLVSLQIRMPDSKWLCLSETNARRALVDQSRFQEALIVAEAYGLNQPSEWALVLWNLMLKPELAEDFVAEFVAVLPLQASMLLELARFYRAEMAARGDQSQFSVWLTGGGLPAEWAKYMWRSFRCLLKRTRDLRLRLQLATTATGFADMVDGCMNALDKVPENAGPLVLKKGHGGGYLPLM